MVWGWEELSAPSLKTIYNTGEEKKLTKGQIVCGNIQIANFSVVNVSPGVRLQGGCQADMQSSAFLTIVDSH